MARPTKYTPDRAASILEAIRTGCTFRLACLSAGVSEPTFYAWQKRYTEFQDAVKVAEGQAALHWLDVIDKAADKGEWTAAAWKLERRYPQEYGRKVQEVQGTNGVPLTFQLQPIDYRDVIAPLAPRPVGDSDPSG